jgi:hypothetical protein
MTVTLIKARCIVQDDSNDWHAESANMYLVYSNATLCIAATAAPNGDAGLFFDRDVTMLTPVEVEVTM